MVCHMTLHTGNEISRVDGLAGLTGLTELVLDRNRIKVSLRNSLKMNNIEWGIAWCIIILL